VVKMYIPDHPSDIGVLCSDAVMFSPHYVLCTIQQSLWPFPMMFFIDISFSFPIIYACFITDGTYFPGRLSEVGKEA